MNLRCLLVDDEPLARKGLREYVEDVDFLTLAGEADSPLKALELLQKEPVHLLFLDIQMPRLTGLELFKTLPAPPPVVFTTAYPQYALEGFELNALDYLVKPVSFERFLKAALRAKEFWELRQAPPPTGDHLFIKVDGRLVRLAYNDILYVEALQNYVAVHTHDRKYLTYLTLHAIEEFLPEALFVKTHKSYLVSIGKIESFEGNTVQVGRHQIPISRHLKEEVIQRVTSGRYPKR